MSSTSRLATAHSRWPATGVTACTSASPSRRQRIEKSILKAMLDEQDELYEPRLRAAVAGGAAIYDGEGGNPKEKAKRKAKTKANGKAKGKAKPRAKRTPKAKGRADDQDPREDDDDEGDEEEDGGDDALSNDEAE